MPDYYVTIPNTWWTANAPANNAKILVGNGVEIHRDDDAFPKSGVVANGSYQLAALSDFATFTAAAPSFSITLIDEGSVSTLISSGSWAFNGRTFTGVPAGGELIMTVNWIAASSPAADIGAPTLDGNAMTLINVGGTDAKTTNQRARSAMFRLARPAGDTTFDVVIPWAAGSIRDMGWTIHYIQGRTSDVALYRSDAFNDPPGTISTTAGGGLIFGVNFELATANGVFSGATLSGAWKTFGGRNAVGIATGTLTESRAISVPRPAGSDADCYIVLSMV